MPSYQVAVGMSQAVPHFLHPETCGRTPTISLKRFPSALVAFLKLTLSSAGSIRNTSAAVVSRYISAGTVITLSSYLGVTIGSQKLLFKQD